MKINNECVRKVLLEIEKIPYGETLTIAKLYEKISEFSIEDILGIITLFNKEHYLTILDKVSYDDNDVLRDHKIKNLTERGYKALDLVKDDEVWDFIKSKIDNFDNLSIFTIFDIANKIINIRHNELFGLPKDLVMPNAKW